jgi:5-enolpyruvylshikimate-3-phosphate synthase
MTMVNARRIEKITHELDAVVSVPGSKSIANRALVCAALASGESVISGVPDGNDTEAMIEALICWVLVSSGPTQCHFSLRHRPRSK